jgi:hypothetical protein
MSKIPPKPKDKRTKAYKEWVKKHESKSDGLGDTIAKVTKATGIDKAVKFIAGKDCGCEERKKKLNDKFSYRKPNCLREEDYNYLSKFMSNKPSLIYKHHQLRLIDIYNYVFNTKKTVTSCGSCIRGVISELEKFYNEYDK